PTGRTPLGSDRDTYLQPVLRDRGNKTATERCRNPATKRMKPHPKGTHHGLRQKPSFSLQHGDRALLAE
ncbi:hypothetical protein, partial [Micrococcus luteus]|uniref:hypothetical protein n=1 Tax=Micrococcus luteus TaxID=1270 RepID=UPI003424E110